MWDYLKNAEKPIVLYGMGNNADRVLNRLQALSIPVAGVFASDDFVRGHSFRGFEVSTYAAAKQKFGDMIVLLCFGSQLPDVMERIKSIAAEQELLVPDMPVAGNEIFDRKYCEENKDKLDRVYNLLADGQSRRVFEAVIDFKLSGRIDQLIDCETTPAEAFENIIKPTDSEIFVDLGAYNGDTVAEFLAFGKANKIYAVEPDARNFKKLTANTAELQSCVCVNAAVSDKPGKVHFSAKSGRNSAILGEGSKIDCVSVDSLLCGNPATYIKMDVEGAEGSAVCGARQTIEKYKPKMLISCYHRSCDLFDIPERVLKVRPDYKIFMRHYPYIPAWDTAFYFV